MYPEGTLQKCDETAGMAMAWPSSHPTGQRDAVEAMIREGALSIVEIAARTGMARSTVYGWSTRLRRRAGKVSKYGRLDPQAWSAARRKAVTRLLTTPENDACDVAQALGGTRKGAQDLRRALALTPRRGAIEGVPSVEALDRDLRIQIGQQIAALGKRLKTSGPNADSGKTLRDLGGLKRMLDDMKPRNDRDGEADEGPREDLAVLRDRIARRCAAIMRARRSGTAAPEPDAG